MLPGTVLQRYFGTNRQVGTATLLFGVCAICLAASKSYAATLSLRILIGAFQALNQGISVYISLWYRRNEIAGRSGNFIECINLQLPD